MLVVLVRSVVSGINDHVSVQIAGSDCEPATRSLVVLACFSGAVLRLPFGRNLLFCDVRQGSAELCCVTLVYTDAGNTEQWARIVVTYGTGGPKPEFLCCPGGLCQKDIQGLARFVDGILQGSHPDSRCLLTGRNGDPSIRRRVVLTCLRSAVFGTPGEGNIVNGR